MYWNATGQRWVAELADFNFKIKDRPGKANADADGLSRMPMDFESFKSQCIQSVCQDAVRATEQGILDQQKEPSPLLSSVSFNALKTQMEDERLLNTVQPLSREEIQAAQQQDPVIGRMYEYKEK